MRRKSSELWLRNVHFADEHVLLSLSERKRKIVRSLSRHGRCEHFTHRLIGTVHRIRVVRRDRRGRYNTMYRHASPRRLTKSRRIPAYHACLTVPSRQMSSVAVMPLRNLLRPIAGPRHGDAAKH